MESLYEQLKGLEIPYGRIKIVPFKVGEIDAEKRKSLESYFSPMTEAEVYFVFENDILEKHATDDVYISKYKCRPIGDIVDDWFNDNFGDRLCATTVPANELIEKGLLKEQEYVDFKGVTCNLEDDVMLYVI